MSKSKRCHYDEEQRRINEFGISKLESKKQYTDYIVISENYDQAVEITKHQKEICFEDSMPYDGKIYYRINPSNLYDTWGHVPVVSWYEKIYPHLPILTYTQWKEMITDKPLNMNKKIIGYKIAQYFPGISANRIFSMKSCELASGYSFEVDSAVAEEYKPFLDGPFFEPVYEKEKESVDLLIGNPVKAIRVKREGFYNILGTDIHGQIPLLKEFVKNSVGETYFPYKWTIKTLWIGCEEEGTLVTIEDIQKVIDTYEKEFGNKFPVS